LCRALSGGRKVERETGVYGDKEVVSRNAGGLFCWDGVLAAHGGDGDATLLVRELGLYTTLQSPIVYWCIAYKRGVGGKAYIAAQ